MSTVGKSSKPVVFFVSGNAAKAQELQIILGDSVDIHVVQEDLPELQGEPEEIARAKCKKAFEQFSPGQLVIVEDTSLCFAALGGMPGPYIKDFFQKIGNEGLYKLLTAYDDKRATAMTCIACTNDGEHIEVFTGKTEGKIVSPRGPPGFGWDPIFQPTNHSKTYAEMDKEMKNSISHRLKALAAFREFIEKKDTSL
jgi:inosine triphosphate pyrophosphatase